MVRAIAASTIPVISAVGHETDTTLADFAADLRAPTPTAAAEMAVPVRDELMVQLGELALRQRRAIARPVQLGRERLAARAERLPAPEALLAPYAQRLDEAGERLRRALRDRAVARGERLHQLGGRLSLPLLAARLDRARGQLDGHARLLASLDPDRVLQRGYVRVTGPDGRTLTNAAAARAAQALALHFRDGTVAAVPADGPSPSPRPAPKPRTPAASQAQGKLL